MKKKIIALVLGFSLFAAGAVNAFAEETEQENLQSLYDALVDAHVIGNILSKH